YPSVPVRCMAPLGSWLIRPFDTPRNSATPAADRRERSKDEGDQHLGRALVLRIGLREAAGHETFLRDRAVGEVRPDQYDHDQPVEADRDRRADHREDDARVDRVADA